MDKNYLKMIEAWKAGKTLCDYPPLHIYVEPTNICNLNCPNCIQSKMQRPRGYMGMGLYEDILEKMKVAKVDRLYLFLHGESTLHPQFDKMVELAKTEGFTVRLQTNGTKDVSNLWVNDLHISINDGLSLQKIKNIDKLVEKGVPFTIDQIEGLEAKIPSKYKHLIAKRWKSNWDKPTSGQDRQRCSHPYKYFCIFWDGKCSPCCVNYESDNLVGDISRQSITEVWNSIGMQLFRYEQARICRTCNAPRTPKED